MNTAINLEKITKALGHREVLKGISFSVEQGDIFGYLGPNGAGKTTTIRILLGLLQAGSGRLDILGRDIEIPATRMMIGFALDPDGLYDTMTASENLQFYADIYNVSGVAARIAHVLKLVGLTGRAGDRVGTYSRGMRQRLSLARAMVHDPEVLILDEPTVGVDPSGQIEIRNILLDIARNETKTVFLSSHNLDEVQRICNRIALIDQGEIKLYGELEQLRQNMGGGNITVETEGPISGTILEELYNSPHLGFQEQKGSLLMFVPAEGTEIPDIVGLLSSKGIRIKGVTTKEASLEELYASILKEVESNG